MANTKSLDLDRVSSQYAKITDGDQTGLDWAGATQDFTLEAWVKLGVTPGLNEIITLMSKEETSSLQNQRSWWWYYRDQSNTKYLGINISTIDGTSAEALQVAQTLTAGTWYHIAVTWDASTKTIEYFTNGSSIGSPAAGTNTVLFNSDAPFVIGTYNDDASGTRFYDGLIDDVRAWDDIRTEAEINNNKAIELCGDEPNLQGYWRMDDDYTDLTSNGNTLTPVGSPVFSADIPTIATNETCGVTRSPGGGVTYCGGGSRTY